NRSESRPTSRRGEWLSSLWSRQFRSPHNCGLPPHLEKSPTGCGCERSADRSHPSVSLTPNCGLPPHLEKSRIFERDTGFEPATFSLGTSGDPSSVQQVAENVRPEKPVSARSSLLRLLDRTQTVPKKTGS